MRMDREGGERLKETLLFGNASTSGEGERTLCQINPNETWLTHSIILNEKILNLGWKP